MGTGASRPTWETSAAYASQIADTARTLARRGWITTNEVCSHSCCGALWPESWARAAEEQDVSYLPIRAGRTHGDPYLYPSPQPYLSQPADRALYAIRSEGSEEDDDADELFQQEHGLGQLPPQPKRYSFEELKPHLPSPTSVPHYSYRPHSLFLEADTPAPAPHSARMAMDHLIEGRTVAAAAHMAPFSAGTPAAAAERPTPHQLPHGREGQRSDEDDEVTTTGEGDSSDELELDDAEDGDEELVPEALTRHGASTLQQQSPQREGQQQPHSARSAMRPTDKHPLSSQGIRRNEGSADSTDHAQHASQHKHGRSKRSKS